MTARLHSFYFVLVFACLFRLPCTCRCPFCLSMLRERRGSVGSLTADGGIHTPFLFQPRLGVAEETAEDCVRHGDYSCWAGCNIANCDKGAYNQCVCDKGYCWKFTGERYPENGWSGWQCIGSSPPTPTPSPPPPPQPSFPSPTPPPPPTSPPSVVVNGNNNQVNSNNKDETRIQIHYNAPEEKSDSVLIIGIVIAVVVCLLLAVPGFTGGHFPQAHFPNMPQKRCLRCGWQRPANDPGKKFCGQCGAPS